MFSRSFAQIGLLALVVSGSSLAGTPIDQTRALNGDGQVSVENVKGRIVVRSWAQAQVKITGTLGAGVEKLQVDGDARSLHIKVKYPDDHGWHIWSNASRAEPSVIEVTIPQHASLDLDAVSADLDVAQMAGRKLSAQTVSGDTRIVASSPGDAHVESVSGDVFLRITTPKVSVESVSGDIDLQGGLTGDVRMNSVSGNLHLGAGRLDSFNLDTVSGDGQLRFDVAPTGVAKAQTLSGDLQVSLPRSASTRLHVETFSGDIRSAVGSVKKEDGPGKTLDARIGDGQGQINLQTFSGDVTVDTQ